jgi:hypothetical protein
MAPDRLPYRRWPCAECPWRRDTPPGQFPACRYDALRETSGRQGFEAPLSAPMFACHKSPDGPEEACAGWLAAVGVDHLGVRLAVIMGQLEPEVCQPGPEWPPLFSSYAEMARTQAADADAPS